MTAARPVVWTVGCAVDGCGVFDAFEVHASGEVTVDRPPAAILVGPMASPSQLPSIARAIDRLRETSPLLAVVVDGQVQSRDLLSRADLVLVNPKDASAAEGCVAVAITGGEEDDSIQTPEAKGWLSLPHARGRDDVLASGAAAAMAKGFVAADALVLGKMAAGQVERTGSAEGFAGDIRNLPGFASPSVGTPLRLLDPPYAPAEHDMGLYAIVDTADWVERVVKAGVRTVQLRIKNPEHPGLRDEVRRAVTAARTAGAQLYINDHWRLAIEEGAYGIHLGQEDLDVADLKAIAEAGIRLGISTHSYWEVCRAWALRPSYIACGPIHPTFAKAMPWIPQGNGNLAYWCALLPLPVVGIAGMDVPRTAEARAAGASGVAVISAITAAPDPEEAIRNLTEAARKGKDPLVRCDLPQPTLPRRTLGSRPGAVTA